MTKHLDLHKIHNSQDMPLFWRLFDDYINELSQHSTYGDAFDLPYFHSEEYRGEVASLRERKEKPLSIVFFRERQIPIGFIMYMHAYEQENECYLMEYYIAPTYRNRGYGTHFYQQSEDLIQSEGFSQIELTPTNEKNAVFWSQAGFRKSTDKDQDNKYIYRKTL